MNSGIATPAARYRALGMSTLAFTVCFAVWTIFSIIGVQIQEEIGLSSTQFGILVATPVLTGSISRVFLGIWAEIHGGRRVFSILMGATAGATWLVSTTTSYPLLLLAALGLGLAGGAFIVGISYTSHWFPKSQQGTALGIFGAGNAGAAITNFAAPFLVAAFGWEMTAQIYASVLLVMAILFWIFTREDPVTLERRAGRGMAAGIRDQLAPLKRQQVWRFSLYYFFVFGAFVALASWLPAYYKGHYGLSLGAAGMLAAAYSLSASVFRALGGWLSDKWGARVVMYWTFGVSLACCFLLSYPATQYRVDGIEGPITFTIAMPIWGFAGLTVLLGFMMSLGKAAVFKHIPVYYPDHVGSVGGLVGMIGGLGGFVLPIIFGIANDIMNIWSSCFMVLTLLVAVNLSWMHFAIRRMELSRHPELRRERYLPEIIEASSES